MKQLSWILLLFLGLGTAVQAAKVDTLKVFSEKMKRNIRVLVFVPDGDGKVPTLYLLHGYGGDERSWSGITDLKQMADDNHLLIVCPNGDRSWY